MQQDAAAGAVPAEFGLAREVCLMHSGDKVGSSAIGDLTRSRMRKVVNAFPDGQALIAKARNMAKHFSYGGTRRKNLDTACEKQNVRSIKPRLDVNGTRVGAKFNLLHSIVVLEKALRQYKLDNAGFSIPTDIEWDGLREMEAVLAVTQQLCLFAQTEKYFMAAMGPLVLNTVHKGLFAGGLEVIDPRSITMKKRDLRRMSVLVESLTDVGETCLERAQLEFERRYCDNSGETINNSKIVLTMPSVLALMLDLRTTRMTAELLSEDGSFQLPDGPDGTMTLVEVGKVLVEEYVELWIAIKRQHFADLDAVRSAATASAAESTLVRQPPSEDEFGFKVIAPTTTACPGPIPQPSESELRAEAEEEFLKSWANWKKLAQNISLEMEKAVEGAQKESVASGDDEETGLEFTQGVVKQWTIIKFNCAREYRYAEENSKDFGLLPMLVRRYCGRLLGESFCERVLSVANRVVTKHNVRLATDDIESVVMLRMNSHLITEMFSQAKTSNDMLRKMAGHSAEASCTPSAPKRLRGNESSIH
mmetsp:Transcript_3136/g.9567  ORF Transcript_3136/g.9567 Transcript_3136/m.9567 type:complete len:534 (-) Transcript_3136:88-1689(-)